MMRDTKAYEALVRTMRTAALEHLLNTRGSVSPEAKDIIRAELAARADTRE